MRTATISSKGQLTLPVAMRRRLGVEPGETLSLEYNPDGSITLRRHRPEPDAGLAGSLREYARGRPATPSDMRRGLRRRAADQFARG